MKKNEKSSYEIDRHTTPQSSAKIPQKCRKHEWEDLQFFFSSLTLLAIPKAYKSIKNKG